MSARDLSPLPPPPVLEQQKLERGRVGHAARSDPPPRRRARPQHAPRGNRRRQGRGATPGLSFSGCCWAVSITSSRAVVAGECAVLLRALAVSGDVDCDHSQCRLLAPFGTG